MQSQNTKDTPPSPPGSTPSPASSFPFDLRSFEEQVAAHVIAVATFERDRRDFENTKARYRQELESEITNPLVHLPVGGRLDGAPCDAQLDSEQGGLRKMFKTSSDPRLLNFNLLRLRTRLNSSQVTIEAMRADGIITQAELVNSLVEISDEEFETLTRRFKRRAPIMNFVKNLPPVVSGDQLIGILRTMSDEEFKAAGYKEKYRKRDRFAFFSVKALSTLPIPFVNRLLSLSESEAESKTKHLSLIATLLDKSPGSLTLEQMNAILSQSKVELLRSQAYLDNKDDVFPNNVISAMNENLATWGRHAPSIPIQYNFPLVSKKKFATTLFGHKNKLEELPQHHYDNYSLSTFGKFKVSDPLYNTLYYVDNTCNEDNDMEKWCDYFLSHRGDSVRALYRYNLLPLCLEYDGPIPHPHANPKIFFSVPHIANGKWIQFAGPGAELPGFNCNFEPEPESSHYYYCDSDAELGHKGKNESKAPSANSDESDAPSAAASSSSSSSSSSAATAAAASASASHSSDGSEVDSFRVHNHFQTQAQSSRSDDSEGEVVPCFSVDQTQPSISQVKSVSEEGPPFPLKIGALFPRDKSGQFEFISSRFGTDWAQGAAHRSLMTKKEWSEYDYGEWYHDSKKAKYQISIKWEHNPRYFRYD